MCACVCVLLCLCSDLNMSMHACVYLYVYVCICVCVHMCMCAYACEDVSVRQVRADIASAVKQGIMSACKHSSQLDTPIRVFWRFFLAFAVSKHAGHIDAPF